MLLVLLAKVLMEKRVIYDIGLHKGEDAEYYLSRGYRVVAIEADPDLVLYCQRKFESFLLSGDMVVFHGAIVEDDDQASVRFYKNKKKSNWGTAVKKWADRNMMLDAPSVEIDVPVVNLRSILLEQGVPYYMKIDIEGMDLVCLKKLCLLDCRPKYVSIESEKTDFSSLIEEFHTLRLLGYRKFFVQQQADMASKTVPIDTQEGPFIDHDFAQGSTGPFGSDLGVVWLTESEAIEKYRKIFKEYKRFGDGSYIRRMPLGIHLTSVLSKIIGRPLPGWYDTHAAAD